MSDANDAQVEVIYDQDFVSIYRGLHRKTCRAIIELFDQDQRKWRGKIGTAQGDVTYDDDTKNSWDLEIINEGIWQPIFQAIHPRIQACISHYLSRSPILQSFDLQMTGYKIQMYPKHEGYFLWHADSAGKGAESRVVAMILYLNDVERGGETAFYHQDIKITPKSGNLMLFPAGWNYMHCGHVPESNNKYIIQSFIKIKD
ncbi:MAG: 2OG-Fe(II) oxygenase [Solimonas sp.]